MTKRDIAKLIAPGLGFTQVQAEAAVGATIDAIRRELALGGRVELRGFGTFEAVERAPRVARNPRTGEAVQVPARRAVRFKPSDDILAAPGPDAA